MLVVIGSDVQGLGKPPGFKGKGQGFCEGSGGFQRLLFLKLQSTLVCVYLLNLSLNIV